MKSRLILILLFLTSTSILCQTTAFITDVDFLIEKNNIIVHYGISNYRANETFSISLIFVTGDNRMIKPVSVYGDIGQGVTGGSNKTIVWNIEQDKLEITGTLKAVVNIISSTVPPPPVSNQNIYKFPAEKKEKKLGGPGYAALGLILPGLGGYFVEENKTRAITYSIVGGAVEISFIANSIKLNDLKDQYQSASSTQKPSIQSEIDATQQTVNASGTALAVIVVTDVIWTMYKGFKNKKARLQGNSAGNGSRLFINYANSGFSAGYRLTF